MNEPIAASYRWTADELITAREYHFKTICRPVYRWLLGLIAVLAILAGWGYYTAGSWWGAIFFPFAGIYWLFLRRWDRRWAVRRHFRKRPDKDAVIEWVLTEDGFCVTMPGSESKTAWDLITKVARAREGFLIYPHPGIFYWLPFHAFSGLEQIEMLEHIFKEHVSQYSQTR